MAMHENQSSHSKTSQAADDAFAGVENGGLLYLDVRANDRGGSAAALYAIGDGGTGATVATSKLGASIRIGTDPATGKAVVIYDVDSLDVDQLAQNEQIIDSFVYAISLGHGHGPISWATADVTITGVNDAPAALDSLIVTNAGQSITGTLGAEDVDHNDALSFAVVSGPSHGRLQVNADGSYEYLPAAGFIGTDSFSFSVTDSANVTDVGSAEITVDGGHAQGREDIVYAPGRDTKFADTTALSDGGHLVVWWGLIESLDLSGAGVFGQRYDANGDRNGDAFLINSYMTADQVNPSAAGLPDGGFVVTWQSYFENPDNSFGGIFAQQFDANGAKVGGEVLINTTLPGNQTDANVEALTNGNFIVSWTGFNSANSSTEVYARIMAPSAGGMTPVTGEFVVNSDTAGDQQTYGATAETVAALEDGRFVVVWTDRSGQDGSGSGVFMRIYEADGTPLTPQQASVTTTVAGDQAKASVGALEDGGFVVTWSSPDDSGTGIFAQRFDADGNKVDGEFAVNTWTTSNQLDPEVTGLSDGGFVIAWSSRDLETIDRGSISGQRYDASGEKVGGEFLINSNPGNDQYPSMTLRDDGALVVNWSNFNTQSYEQKIITNFNGTGGAKTIVGGEGDDSFIGSSFADVLNGAGGNDHLEGLAGNDQLTGGAGSDTFMFGGHFANDTVTDFGEGRDVLEFRGLFADLDAVVAATSEDAAGNAVIASGSDQVTLAGVSKTELVEHLDQILLV